MSRIDLPTWVVSLDDDDLQLIRRFVLASGSLKQLAEDYGELAPKTGKELLHLHQQTKGAQK
jgi:hypothetical protein